jgi:hypothetical protein
MIEDHKITKQQNDNQITDLKQQIKSIESGLKRSGIDSKEEKRLINLRDDNVNEIRKLNANLTKIVSETETAKSFIIDAQEEIKKAEKALGVKDKEVKDEKSKVIEEQKTVDAKIEEKVKELEKDIVKTAEEKRQEKRERKREISKQK